MSFFSRVRSRLSGFQAQADSDPHHWRLPKYSQSRKSLNRVSTGLSNDSSSGGFQNNGSGNGSPNGGGGDGNGSLPRLIPDPAIFRNAFVPISATGADDNGVAPEGDRLTYPDAGHAAVHLALLECFAGLRRQAGLLLPADVDGHGVLPPSYDSHSKSSSPDVDAADADAASVRLHEINSGASTESGSLSSADEEAIDDDEDDDASSTPGSPGPDLAQSEEARRRWDLLVRLAVTRFGVWWANIDKVLSHAAAYTPSYYRRPAPGQARSGGDGEQDLGVVQLTPDYLPPLDVLMVWYAFIILPPSHSDRENPPYSQNGDAASVVSGLRTPHFAPASAASSSPSYDPTPYDTACSARPGTFAASHLCFPWPAIKEVLDLSPSSPSSTTCEYNLPKAAANLFRTLSGQPADVAEYLESPPAYTARDVAFSYRFGGGGCGLQPPSGEDGPDAEAAGFEVEVDLVDAVKKHVEPFIERAAELDWLRSPALPGSLERSLQAYTDELILGDPGEGENEDGLLWDGNPSAPSGDEGAPASSDGSPAGPGPSRLLLSFGVELAWRTHRLFPSQYRMFCEAGGVAALRRAAVAAALLDEDGGESKKGGSLEQKRQRRRRLGPHACACWTCERVRDEAPEFAWDARLVSGKDTSNCFDPESLRGLSWDQIKNICEDLGLYHAARLARAGRGLPRSRARVGRIIKRRGVKADEVRRWSAVMN